MKFLIFNLSVVAALAYLILGQEQLSDIGSKVTEKGGVSLEKAIAFLNTPNSKEITDKTTGIKRAIKPEEKPEPIAMQQTTTPELRANDIAKIAPDKNNQLKQSIDVPPLPQPEAIRVLPETNAPRPAVSVAASSRRGSYPVPLEIAEQRQPEFMSNEERRKELLKIARSAEKLFIRRLTQ